MNLKFGWIFLVLRRFKWIGTGLEVAAMRYVMLAEAVAARRSASTSLASTSAPPFRQGAIVLVPVKDAIAATAVAKRPSLTGPARGGVAGRQVGTKGWPTRSNKGMDLGHVHNPGYVP
jgi:hypothetical protein